MANRRRTSTTTTLAKVSFYTFIVAAFAFFIQALLKKLGIESRILDMVQSIVIMILFIVVGLMGWRYSRSSSLLVRILYIVCSIIILVAVVLPVI